MKSGITTCSVLVLFALTCTAQQMTQQEAEAKSQQHIAAIQPKIIGKWETKDKRRYIDFLPDGSCSQGVLWDDGIWHIDKGKLWAYPVGNDFSCKGGALTLANANLIVEDFGMGGVPFKYYRLKR